MACDLDITRGQIGMSPPLLLLSEDTLSSVTSLLAKDSLSSSNVASSVSMNGQGLSSLACVVGSASDNPAVTVAVSRESRFCQDGSTAIQACLSSGTGAQVSLARSDVSVPEDNEQSSLETEQTTEHRHLQTSDVPGKRVLSEARCGPCGLTFESWQARDGHMSQRHLSVDCSVCGQQSAGLEAYKQHMQSHSQSSSYRCHRCDRNFLHPSALLSHLEKTHWDSSRGCCLLCGFTSRTKGRHFHEHLPEAPINGVDPLGENTVELTNAVRENRSLTDNSSHVNIGLPLQVGTNNHISKVHENQFKSSCDITLKNRDTINSSMGNPELPEIYTENTPRCLDRLVLPKGACYPCDSCGEVFVREELLTNHRLYLHMAFQCHWCDERVCGFAAYQLHVSNHAKTGLYKDVSQDPKVLRTHALKLPPQALPHRKPGTFPCATCGRVCATLKAYSAHMAQHVADSPHQCPVCRQRFLHQVALTAHCRRKHRTVITTKKSAVTLWQGWDKNVFNFSIFL